MRNDRDYNDVDLQKTRKRYVVRESSDFTRNMFWLASCFSKIKKPNSHFLGNQSGIAGVHNFTFIIVIFWYELQLVDLCGTREIYKIERYRVKEC